MGDVLEVTALIKNKTEGKIRNGCIFIVPKTTPVKLTGRPKLIRQFFFMGGEYSTKIRPLNNSTNFNSVVPRSKF